MSQLPLSFDLEDYRSPIKRNRKKNQTRGFVGFFRRERTNNGRVSDNIHFSITKFDALRAGLKAGDPVSIKCIDILRRRLMISLNRTPAPGGPKVAAWKNKKMEYTITIQISDPGIKNFFPIVHDGKKNRTVWLIIEDTISDQGIVFQMPTQEKINARLESKKSVFLNLAVEN